MSSERSTINEIKHKLRKTDDSTYYYVIRSLYGQYGNPLINRALAELEQEE